MAFTFNIKNGTHQLSEFVLRSSVGSGDLMNLVLTGTLTVEGILTPDGKLTRASMIQIAKTFIISERLYENKMYASHLRMFWRLYTKQAYAESHTKEIYVFLLPIVRACVQKFNEIKRRAKTPRRT